MNKWILLGGLGGLGVLSVVMMASGDEREDEARAPDAPDPKEEWIERVIARVALHEGRYDSLNRNRDGAGLSFGMLQWAQRPGSLGVLLRTMNRLEPAQFRGVFGANWRSLLVETAKSGVRRVAGAHLWTEPWASRFRRAGKTPELQRVQMHLARHGEHFQGAVEAARVLGIRTERSMVLFFDTSIQQGPKRAVQIAERLKQRVQGRDDVGYREMLVLYAHSCANRYRRESAPTKPYPADHIAWQKTGNEWHAWAGEFDLYTNILKRRMSIVRDGGLSDGTVRLPVA